MSGIRVNIQSGTVTRLNSPRDRAVEVRSCERCHHNFEARRNQSTRFCSISCSKKGQQNRLGAKHTPETIEKMKKIIQERYDKQIEIMPHAKIRNRAKKPRFVNNHQKWANLIFSKFKALGRIPHHKSDEYGLYKYGEWLFNNETYERIIYEKDNR